MECSEGKKMSDQVRSLKLEVEEVMLNVVNGNVPQEVCELVEKRKINE